MEEEPRMIDVSGKEPTLRKAKARATVRMKAEVLEKLVAGKLPKGDALAVARIAAIQAAKETARLIPMCHAIPVEYVEVEFRPAPPHSIEVIATATATAKTGVEMEALVAAAVAALNIYDMCKALDRGTVIEGLRLLEKSGGRSGDYRAEDA